MRRIHQAGGPNSLPNSKDLGRGELSSRWASRLVLSGEDKRMDRAIEEGTWPWTSIHEHEILKIPTPLPAV